MEQKLFTEILPLYKSRKNNPYAIRLRIRLSDNIDPVILQNAINTTMKRYPYFCVRLSCDEQKFTFWDNTQPVVLSNSPYGIELNTAESNHHMISFSWYDNWIILDIFHGLTDGTGAYEIIRTLLYYYCSSRYNVKLSSEGIRTLEDNISVEEWNCPVMNAANLPTPKRYEMLEPLNPIIEANLQQEQYSTTYSIEIPEADFMRFNRQNGGSPATMVSLLLCHAIAKLFPNATKPIRIILAVNQRKALHTPLAHQSLVGGALIEYEERLRHLPISKQVKVFREMVSRQTTEESVFAGISSIVALTKNLLSKSTNEERVAIATLADEMATRIGSACVSYVGKGNLGEAEKYVREFHLWSYNSLPITIQMSAVNGKFTLDFIQKFSSSVYVNVFLEILAEHGIPYDFHSGGRQELPNIQLPWN